jgi:hypothetical protein
MKTLLIMIIIWIIVSVITTYLYSNKSWNRYNLFNGPFWAYMGNLIGMGFIFCGIVYLIVKYLP